MNRPCAPLLMLLLAAALAPPAAAETIYTGDPITFTKQAFGDVSDAANRDIIIPGVVELTRGDSGGLFNFAAEDFYTGSSPADTEWAFEVGNPLQTVRAGNFAALSFAPWATAVSNNPPARVGEDAVLHIISQDIYVDVTFLSWNRGTRVGGLGGGGFSYSRATAAPEPTAAALLLLAGLAALSRGRARTRG